MQWWCGTGGVHLSIACHNRCEFGYQMSMSMLLKVAQGRQRSLEVVQGRLRSIISRIQRFTTATTPCRSPLLTSSTCIYLEWCGGTQNHHHRLKPKLNQQINTRLKTNIQLNENKIYALLLLLNYFIILFFFHNYFPGGPGESGYFGEGVNLLI